MAGALRDHCQLLAVWARLEVQTCGLTFDIQNRLWRLLADQLVFVAHDCAS